MIGDKAAAITTASADIEVPYTSCQSNWRIQLYERLLIFETTTDDDDHYDRRQRRKTYNAPVPVRLRRQLLSIADSPLRRWNEEVLSLANMLVDNQDDEQLRSTFISLVMLMLVEQPLKIPFVAAVVLVANALKSEIMGAVLERLGQELQTAIAQGQWREVKLYLRFLACMQGNLEGDGVFPLLDELFNRAADLQTASSEDASFHRVAIVSFPAANTIIDYRNRNRKDHPINDPIRHGCRTGSV